MFEEGRVTDINGNFNLRDAIKKFTMLPNIDLDAEEAEKFWEGVWDLTSIKNIARKVNMKSQKKKIRHLGLTERVMHPVGTMDATKIVTTALENEIELSTTESRAAILILDSDLEDMNVGSAAEFRAAIIRIFTNKIKNEVEELAWIGESTTDLSGFTNDDIRSTRDGWRYQLDHSQTGETYVNSVTGSAVILDASNTVTARAASFTISSTDAVVEFAGSEPWHPDFKLSYFMDHMPVEYLALEGDMKFFMHNRLWRMELRHERKLGTEIAHMSLRNPNGFDEFDGIPVVPFPQMPLTMAIKDAGQKEKLDTTTPGDLTDILLTPANNLVYGVQLDLMMERERSAANRGNIYWFTVRDDAVIHDVHACIFGKRFKVV